MSSVPLRPRSPIFSFDTETGARRPRWFVALAALLALLIATAGILVGVSAANAHTPNASADCYKVNVDMRSYNTHGGQNTIKVTIGTQVVKDTTFATEIIESFAIADPTVATAWKVEVTAWDDTDNNPNQGYSRVFSGTTTPCAAPAITLTPTACNAVDGAGRLVVTVNSLLPGQAYSGQLLQNGSAFQTFTPTSVNPTATFDPIPAGFTYTVIVSSGNPTGLTASKDVFIAPCPQNSRLSVTVSECSATGVPNAAVVANASELVPQRSYTAQVFQGNAPLGTPVAVTVVSVPGPTYGTATVTIAVPPSTADLSVVIVDTASGLTTRSSAFTTAPCPTQPSLQVASDECTVIDGKLEVKVTFGGLTPGRSYLVQIDGGQVAEVVATASDEVRVGTSPATRTLVFPVSAGSHTVTVIDKAAPDVKASADVTVKACPTQPVVAIDVTECSVPGGTGTITVTSLTGLSTGRTYTVTITQGAGQAVPGYAPVQVTAANSTVAPYTGLAPGIGYTVTIVDDAAGLMDAESALLKACPNTPDVTLTLQCLLLDGDSLVTATVADLEDGEQYLIEVFDTPAAGGAGAAALAAPVASAPLTGGPTPSTATFQVPNNVNYTFTVTKVGNAAVTGSATIFAAICDLPTFELPTLALTGAGDTALPMLGALGLVQFGVALLALAAMLQFAPRRRSA